METCSDSAVRSGNYHKWIKISRSLAEPMYRNLVTTTVDTDPWLVIETAFDKCFVFIMQCSFAQ